MTGSARNNRHKDRHAGHPGIARKPAGNRAGPGQLHSRAESGPSGYSSAH